MGADNGPDYCAGCDNPGCRHGGCQGRKPEPSVNAAPEWFPRAWSPTSLAGLETCPRRWALRRAGWARKPDPLRPAAPHAAFGRLWHAAAEHFDIARFNGVPIEAATEDAIERAL